MFFRYLRRHLSTTSNAIALLSRPQFKIGRIVDVVKHPNADKLYVSAISMGNNPESGTSNTLTVCSGLVDYFSIPELLQRRVVVVTNLKPSKMRGVRSEAMLLAGEKSGNVELVEPPTSGREGESLHFEGVKITPEGNTNQLQLPVKPLKKSEWSQLAEGLQTNDQREVVFYSRIGTKRYYALVGNSTEKCTLATLAQAVVR
ncbi:BA75_02873T0 [Komagataella pastoris]|uniref:BA75_02873T0 n=1 Tax=Komagataella pastoris TaxID=4922 RepID=A0A1B2JB02_PICPA|nr:BA75_02873T0 [Komagataella pastoris]